MTAILFIHGFPFDRAMWRYQTSELSRWQCVAPDLHGAGASPGLRDPGEYTVTAYAAQLIGVLDRLQIRRAVICGLSMGGYIAFEMLRRYRERVQALVLCDTKAAADTPETKRDRDAMAELARQRGAGAVAERMIPKVLSTASIRGNPQLVDEVRDMIERQSVEGIVGALHALRERPDSTPMLSRIAVPVLVLAGTDDQVTPAQGMEQMAASIPGSTFAAIANAGHLAPLEQPRAVNAAISDFLQTVG